MADETFVVPFWRKGGHAFLCIRDSCIKLEGIFAVVVVCLTIDRKHCVAAEKPKR